MYTLNLLSPASVSDFFHLRPRQLLIELARSETMTNISPEIHRSGVRAVNGRKMNGNGRKRPQNGRKWPQKAGNGSECSLPHAAIN